MKMKKLVVTMFAAGVLASPLANATNGYFSHGYGMKAKGMAGVGIALPQDSLAAATNPAGMVMVGDRIDLGLDLFKPNRSAQITGAGAPGANGTYSGNNKSLFFIPEFGYNKMMSADSSLGVSVYGNGGMNTDYAVNPYGAYGGTTAAGVNLEQLFIAPTWATKINSTNAIGVSLNLAYQKFSANGLQGFTGSSASPLNVTNNGNDSSTGYGLHIGWTGQITPSVTLGATYQSKTKMGKLNKYSGLFAGQGSFDIPASYGVGIAVKATPATTVAADIETIQFSGVPAVGNPLANLLAGNPLGSNNGPGFGWKDVTTFKLGVSQEFDPTLTLRAGYSHNNQPIPSGQTFLNILAPATIQDHITLGATWKLASKSELTVAYMHGFKKTVNGVGSIPAVPFGGGEANISLSEDSLGVAYSW